MKTAEGENSASYRSDEKDPQIAGTPPPCRVRNQQVRGSNPRAGFDFSPATGGG
jgi:hypothetical protein